VSPFDAVCAGESMALVTPHPPRPLAEGGSATIDVAGAESTVACYLLPAPAILVVKDAAVGATSYGPAGATFVPTPPAEVVEPVGAGDAYAAGYLSGLLRDLPEPARLRLGHLAAAAALRVTGDVGPLPPADELIAAAAG
jgi:2-dehydro-3-deoxygluconokinase